MLQALAVGRGLPDGLTFANPPLFKYLLLAEYATDYALERVAGHVRTQQDFVDRFRADPSRLYLLARLTSATFGAVGGPNRPAFAFRSTDFFAHGANFGVEIRY